ncbi:hypothetical protein [Rhizobacter sp. OV335]|uniref:hypothetical protein n=1 Tax=Rhizobacter sp. OV335 TaxID=1500264 RepID=UPI00092157F2|nr:hypothetical protein [Rhizobacter sp. OV335]SHN31042.1 hypothetical protein SAMN02787076_05020 [Rhizobacter sp. OV335]
MRVLLAAIFVYGAMLGAIGWLSSAYGEGRWPAWTTALAPLVVVAALVSAAVLFNRSGFRPRFRRISPDQRVAELEAKGLLLRQSFQARRAFAVEAYEDEGPHYLIELTDGGPADGRVLYLNGQYLHDHEPITDDPSMNQSRTFPCTEFEVLRHRKAGCVLQIRCGGTMIEPELIASRRIWEESRIERHEDGDLIADKTYDTLKREWTSRGVAAS